MEEDESPLGRALEAGATAEKTISMNMSESKKTKKDDLLQVEQVRKADSKINRITRRWKILQEYKYGQLKMKSLDKREMLEC